MKAMILAAGRGERLRPLTDQLPKPLVKVAGKSLIEYHLEQLAKLGIQEVVINHAWLGEKIEQQLGDGSRWQLNIRYSAEAQALETGGGICQALPLLTQGEINEHSAPFLVVNGDIFLGQFPSPEQLMLPQGQLGKLFMVPNPIHHPTGDFALAPLNQQAQLQLAQPDASSNLTFSGLGVYHPLLFAQAPKGAFPLSLLLKQAIAQGKLIGERFTDYWCDVGTLERLQQAEQYVAKQR